MQKGLRLPDLTHRIPEKHEIYTDEEAKKYINGCDYPETADYAIPAAIINSRYCVKGKRILETCSGPGALTYELYELGAREAIGVDASRIMIEHALKKYKRGPGMDFIVAEVRNLPFRDNSFDIVVNQNSWHQFHEPFKPLEELIRVMRPGGYGVIFDFRRDAGEDVMQQRISYTKPEIVPLLFESLLASFTQKEFEETLNRIQNIEYSIESTPDPRGLSERVDELIKRDPVPHWKDYSIGILMMVEIKKLK